MEKIMKASKLISKAKDIAKNYKTLYVMGCFGSPMNDTNKKRYTTNNAYNKQSSRTKMINAASSDTFGFDCVNLIKGILWGWTGDKSHTYGGAKYGSNGVADINANTMMTSNYCTDISTDFKKIVAGEILWCTGHVGIYIGDGLAVECTPAFKNKVQITAVGNVGKKEGYSTRTWTKHGKLKYIDYTSTSDITYFKKYTGESGSITEALKAIGVDYSFSYRTKIANKNGITDYSGKSNENIKLLNLLKQGKLVKP